MACPAGGEEGAALGAGEAVTSTGALLPSPSSLATCLPIRGELYYSYSIICIVLFLFHYLYCIIPIPLFVLSSYSIVLYYSYSIICIVLFLSIVLLFYYHSIVLYYSYSIICIVYIIVLYYLFASHCMHCSEFL